MLRLGLSIGPFVIAGLITLGAGPTASFYVQGGAAIAIVVLLLVLKDPERTLAAVDTEQSEAVAAAARPEGMVATFRRNRRVLGTVGVGAAALSALRQSRQVILPLWAVAIALDPEVSAVIIGVAGFIDFALFYTGGWVMDRFGRMWVVMPVTIGLAIGHILLAVTGLLPWPLVTFAVVAGLLSIANGLGSGVLMTLSADLAEPENPGPFLALWRLLQGLGGAAAPLVIAGVTALASLPVAAAVIGVLGLGGAWVFGRSLPPVRPAFAAGSARRGPTRRGGARVSGASRVLRIAAAVILDADGRILLVRKTGTDAFMQPGGKLEPGESAAECLVRELHEELALEVAVADLEPIGRFAADAANEAGGTVDCDVSGSEVSTRRCATTRAA